MKLKFKYYWKGNVYFIDFSKNTVPQFDLYEKRNKTSPLLQSIGATLKGKEAYIGDIVYDEMEHIYDTIVFNNKNCWIWCENNDIEVEDSEIMHWDSIVGNIYKNPEILEEGN